MSTTTFTSESVTEGHPDKVADQISDAVLDAALAQDPGARVACETLVTPATVYVAGEMTTTATFDIEQIVREKVIAIGYDRPELRFDGATVAVEVVMGQQSGDISQGVDGSEESRSGATDAIDRQGAGDQGMMFGYACDDTETLMPLPVHLAHRLSERLAQVRQDGTLPWLRPDGKTQVTVRYQDGEPVGIETVLISTQHDADVSRDETIRPALIEHVITPVLPAPYLAENPTIHINPTGRFVIGGPAGDAGLTGRKIIVDTYGGMGRHGGGAFSGKDATKVDRSAAYAARWVAKHVVASGAARRCELQIAYAIGIANPVSILVETFGTATIDPQRISDAVRKVFDLRPAAIIRDLDLRRPCFSETATYGHFGRTGEAFTWERTSRLSDFVAAVGL
ncbi:MAG: methionine adenosyltransferase [Actinobacteria bacterium]|nr:methionine adenosyltransferase [Actinomycetota bacterium]